MCLVGDIKVYSFHSREWYRNIVIADYYCFLLVLGALGVTRSRRGLR
jgi:hypothetical protein